MTPDREDLTAWIDGELPAEAAAAVAARIARDPAWAAEAERLRHARDAVRALGTTPAPGGFADDVLARLDDTPTTSTPWPWVGGAIAIAAAVVLWLAIPAPTPPAPPVTPTPAVEIEVHAVGVGEVVQAPSGWRVAASDEALRSAVEAAGAGIAQADDDHWVLEIPAARIPALEARLGAAGPLEALGPRRPVSGRVRLRLERVR